ncbi:unnamed protein product [Urochloa humidicola]
MDYKIIGYSNWMKGSKLVKPCVGKQVVVCLTKRKCMDSSCNQAFPYDSTTVLCGPCGSKSEWQGAPENSHRTLQCLIGLALAVSDVSMAPIYL